MAAASGYPDLVVGSLLSAPGVDPAVVRVPTAAGTTRDVAIDGTALVRPPPAELDRFLAPRVRQSFDAATVALVPCRVIARADAGVTVLVALADGTAAPLTVPPAAVARRPRSGPQRR